MAGCARGSALDRIRAGEPLTMIGTQAAYHVVNLGIADHVVRRRMVPVVQPMETERRAGKESPTFAVTAIAAAPAFCDERTEGARLWRDLQACGFTIASL